jgi:hypothetical protein
MQLSNRSTTEHSTARNHQCQRRWSITTHHEHKRFTNQRNVETVKWPRPPRRERNLCLVGFPLFLYRSNTQWHYNKAAQADLCLCPRAHLTMGVRDAVQIDDLTSTVLFCFTVPAYG